MTEEGDKKVVVREVNLEELMEVVTSYRCRFCEFTCSGMQDMTTHLQKTHMMTSTLPKTAAAEPEAATHSPEPELKPASSPDPEPEPELACEEEDGQAEEPPATYETPPLLSNLGLASSHQPGPESPSLVVQPALPDPKVLTNQVRSVAKNLPLMASSQPELGLFSLTTSAGTQSLPITSLHLTGPGLTLATTATTIDSISVPVGNSTKDLGMGPTSIAPITRELFLCGVCSVGFISVDECKYHMEREHNTPLESVSVSDTIVDKFEQRVSVGTQATGKRPGRKRKSEMPPPPSSPPARKAKLQEDEDDEDWLPGRSLSLGTRDGKQRRKIRTPKALKEDYVIEKKRKYRKRRMAIKESYTLTCSYLGCSTKFRCQESLDVHLDCHNKEDDAFTCFTCNTVFEVWKPLRIHLWRNHNIDCDMFQCDVCEYKTDTLHKLGVHREIHSDNRPYTCDVCGKGFKQLSQMKNHQIIHAEHQRSGRETWFSNKTCETCKRTFANSKCLKKHVEAVHGNNKPFKCQYCSHTTAWKAMLILHERAHTGEKPFKCDVCPYATGDHNSLRRHKMRHTGQRQYKCQLCAYTCIQTISLKTHMRNKHPNAEGVVYLCPLCKFCTINKQIYDNHMADHHNGLIPEVKSDLAPNRQSSLAVSVEAVANSMAILPEGTAQFQLQVKRMETGELHANKEDIDKLNSIPDLVNSGMDANQLIYSALNIGGNTEGMTYTAQLLNGVQSTVSPSLQSAGKGVLSSYTITFHAPQVVATQTGTDGQTIVYQSLTEQDLPVVDAASQDESLEPSSQGAEQDGEGILALAEGSQAQSVEQVSQILYSPSHIQSNTDLQAEQDSHFQAMQTASSDSPPCENEVEKVTNNFSAPGGGVVVSEAGHIVEGMEGVLLPEGSHSIMVMEGGQVVEQMLVMGAGGEQADAGSVSDVASQAEMDGEKEEDGYPMEQETEMKAETDDGEEQS